MTLDEGAKLLRGDEIAERYVEGASMAELAKHFGVSYVTIYESLEEHQVQRRKPGPIPGRDPDDLDMEGVAQLYLDGAPIIEIEIMSGLNPNTIYKYLHQAGIQPRNLSRKKRLAILREARLRETVQSIAATTGLEPERVQKVVDQAGLTDYVKHDHEAG